MKLSIITINYNNKEGLQKTIDSVVCQTWHDFEWIVIDGGSSDGSKELIEQYQQHFSYWCSEPDKGVYNAMNKGIDHAHGDYVNFMNSGDAFHDDEVLKSIFEKELYGDILIGQVNCVGKDLIVNRLDNGGCDIGWKRVNEGFCHQGTFSRLKMLKVYPFDENLKIASDWKFWCQTIMFDNCSIQDLDMIVTDYDMTGISSNTENDELQLKERELIKQSLFPPRILKELQDYQTLRNTPYVYGMKYIEKCNYVIFLFFRKLISLVYRFLYRPTI